MSCLGRLEPDKNSVRGLPVADRGSDKFPGRFVQSDFSRLQVERVEYGPDSRRGLHAVQQIVVDALKAGGLR